MPRHREGPARPPLPPEPSAGPGHLDTMDWEDPPPPARLWRSRILLPAVLMIAVVAGAWWTVSWLTTATASGPTPTPVAISEREGSTETSDSPAGAKDAARASDEVVVHIAGEVRQPGIVRLPAASRVVDAVEAGGGPTEDADLDEVNLAAEVTDGAQIFIPGPGGAAGTDSAHPSSGGESASSAGGASGASTVNLNTADPTQLETLPGIGPALAQRIIDHREQVGPYTGLADLDGVSGIGPAMLTRLDGRVSW